MKYWPTSELFGVMTPQHRSEIARLYTNEVPLPYTTLVSLHQLAFRLPACTEMVIVQSEGAAFRRVYLKHPTQANWLKLERGGFVATDDNFGFVMDALH